MAKEELSRIRNQKVPERSFSSLHHPFVPNVPNVTAGVCVALKQHESRAFKTHSTPKRIGHEIDSWFSGIFLSFFGSTLLLTELLPMTTGGALKFKKSHWPK